jgi:galactokinase
MEKLPDAAFHDKGLAAIKMGLQARYPEITRLRDAEEYMLKALEGQLDPAMLHRIRFAAEESRHVQRMAMALQAGDSYLFGVLLYSAHAERLYPGGETYSMELRALVNYALTFPGACAVGLRILAENFGGFMLALVLTVELPQFQKQIFYYCQGKFARSPRYYPVEISEGAQVWR